MAGIEQRLPYLAELGVDSVWITPTGSPIKDLTPADLARIGLDVYDLAPGAAVIVGPAAEREARIRVERRGMITPPGCAEIGATTHARVPEPGAPGSDRWR